MPTARKQTKPDPLSEEQYLRSVFFLLNGYSAKRTSEIVGVPVSACEAIKVNEDIEIIAFWRER
jgi:hypothetical protein